MLKGHTLTESKIRFDPSIFSIEAIQKGVYRLSHLATFTIETKDEQIEVSVVDEKEGIWLQALIGKLNQHVLDYSLREKISKETENSRNLILSTAFARIIAQNKSPNE